MRKTLKNIILDKQEEAKNEIVDKQARLEEAVVACVELYKKNKDLTKRVTAYKDEIKQLFNDLGILEYTATDGSKITMSVIDKTTIDQEQLINYLKEKGLNQFIHTKEYIDENEIAYAVAQDTINASDLAPMQIEKTEYRMNIK